MSEEQKLEELDSVTLARMVREKRSAEQSLRERLRSAEGERDVLRGTVTAETRQRFHDYATEHQLRKEALDDVDGRIKLDDLLSEDGTLDTGKVDSALQGLRETHGYYFDVPQVPRSSGSGMHTGSGVGIPIAKPTMQDFLQDS